MAGMWSTLEVGTSTKGYELSDLTNPQKSDTRKVTSSVKGDGEKIVSEGDQSLFKTSNEMGKDAFLNLLVTQLKYQDPLAPQADTQFVSQLAQFSALETNKTMESSIQNLSESMSTFMTMQTLNSASTVNAASTSLLGKSVRIAQTSIEFAGKNVDMNIQLNDGQKSAWVAVKNAKGDYLSYDRIEAKNGETDIAFKWDGVGEDGKTVPYGEYTIEILDESKLKSAGTAYAEGSVEGLRYTSDGARLIVDGGAYPLKDILKVDSDA